ncbi:hypothetical protein DRN73_05760 [Candidatus Pacearchaeota archaeon]|nr:MAG: hypothetical protein DRN73_05760 [Candidatus Pacearchaeota archaeon]
MKKKLIINATNVGKKISGIGRGTLSLLKEIDKLLGLNKIPEYEIIVYANKKMYSVFSQFNNLKIKYVTDLLSPDIGFRGHFLRLIWTNFLGLKEKNSIIFNTSQLEGQIIPLSKRKNVIITLIYDLIPYIYKFPKQVYYYKYFLPFVINNSYKIITVSNYSKNLIQYIYKCDAKKIIVIPLGVSENFYLTNQERKNWILYVGRFHKIKNINGIIKAFSILINRYKLDYKLILVGPNNLDLNQYNFLDKNLKSRISIYININDIKLRELYNTASLFIFPSFYEGFGLPPLEAMACGCPVVVSNTTSLPEVCGDAAYYVNPYNIENIAEGMYKVLTDFSLRKTLIKKGLERVKQFSWEKAIKKFLKIVEKITNEFNND